MTKNVCNVTKDSPTDCESMSTKKFLITVVPLAVVLSLVFFAIIQFIGERLGLLPYIFVSGSIFTNGEDIIMFIIVLGTSIVVALIVAFLLYKLSNTRKKEKMKKGH